MNQKLARKLRQVAIRLCREREGWEDLCFDDQMELLATAERLVKKAWSEQSACADDAPALQEPPDLTGSGLPKPPPVDV